MSFNSRDLELKDRIVRNTTKSLMWADKQKKEEKVALIDFMKEIGKVFIYIAGDSRKDIVLTYLPESIEARKQELEDKEKLNANEEEELKKIENTMFVNVSFLIAAEDATPRANVAEKLILNRWVSVLVDRLRSKTRSKRIISLIITEMFLQFITCYSQHKRKTYSIYDLLMMSVETMQSEASRALLDFLESDAAEAFKGAKQSKKEDKKGKIEAI